MKRAFQFVISLLKYRYFRSKCKNIDYFNYKKLVEYDFDPPMFFRSVTFYGNYKAVAKLSKKHFNFLREYLEHGVCFINTPDSARLLGYGNRPFIKTIYTYGPLRKRLIEEYLQENHLKRRVIAIGPYIKGSSNFHSAKKLLEIKKNYGRILLVYPQHSIKNVNVYYEIEDLKREINFHKSDFDSVFVCIYWKDLLNHPNVVTEYESEGYIVVSNGHRSDPFFLSRQKDLIELSDMMMTNGLGTHIGYSICMHKPVFYYNQAVTVKDDNNILLDRDNISEVEKSFAKEFGKYSQTISESQYKLVKLYWGDFEVEDENSSVFAHFEADELSNTLINKVLPPHPQHACRKLVEFEIIKTFTENKVSILIFLDYSKGIHPLLSFICIKEPVSLTIDIRCSKCTSFVCLLFSFSEKDKCFQNNTASTTTSGRAA